MRVVREQRGSARGARAGDDPCVGAPAPWRAEGVEERAARARRAKSARVRRRAGEAAAAGELVDPAASAIQARSSSRSQLPDSPHESSTNAAAQTASSSGTPAADRAACTRAGARASSSVGLPRRCSGRSMPGLVAAESVDPGRTPARNRSCMRHGVRVPASHDAGAGAVEPHRSREPVVVERALAEQLAQAAVRRAEREVELEQPFAGRDHALREPEIVERGGLDVWHAPRIAPHGGRFAAAHRARARHRPGTAGGLGHRAAALRAGPSSLTPGRPGAGCCRASCRTDPAYTPPRATSSSWVPRSTISPWSKTSTRSACSAVVESRCAIVTVVRPALRGAAAPR